jgi:hypothetical protein
MSERRRKRRFFDIFGFGEEEFPFGQTVEGGSGYSISVTYDERGKPVVRVETYGDVDVAELRKDIEQRYPGARIEGLEKQPLIRIVGEEETMEERKPEKERRKAEKRKRSLIRVVE